MNKELLEALERLAMPDELHISECKKLGIGLTEDYDLLEQALLNAEKEHKALEIIKKKRVNVGTFIHLTKILKKDYEKCKALNNTFGANICETEKELLTKEEFNLLKEVLE